jgi:hypothetical protein
MKNLNIALVALFAGCTSLYGADLAERKNQVRNMFINQYVPAEHRAGFYNQLGAAATRAEIDLVLQNVINAYALAHLNNPNQ